MSTKAIIGVLAAIIVIGGGAWYFSTQQPMAPQTGDQSATGAQSDSGTTTFAQFLAAGGSRSCDVTVANADAPATGVVYVSGTQVRSDFTTKPKNLNGQSVSAHMLQTGGFVYTWTDLMPQGVKVKTDAVASVGANSSSAISPNAEVQYDCTPWVPDASKFTVPASISFTEFTTTSPK